MIQDFDILILITCYSLCYYEQKLWTGKYTQLHKNCNDINIIIYTD